MNIEQLKTLLLEVKNDQCDIETALNQLKILPYEDLEYAKVDHHRELRNGYPEVIYSPGKSLDQIKGIVQNMLKRSQGNILASRADLSVYEVVKSVTDDAIYYEEARSVVVKRQEYKTTDSYILVVSAGTADIPIAEEAAITATVMGNQVKRLYDVGVAGIHRLLNNVSIINDAKTIIVVAGMEGALASVVGGLTDKPIIAVPTSIGYGANFGGVSALLGMLTSCASGIGVVNIDNGFGAACMASKINKI
ncbi:MAG: pyridinium-3,5-biscarboxylic acid mononucleotide synthase [Eubacteriaceae bacterium]|jgi:NCAIR mutase (PurE)-related protein|nr:pyridinium-3,5-biscarboxylic acid mononucleotide synthase [Eubacteriaceae bacterium]MDK2904030.1 pyridinium-3,5-biscarboxylic acid mononucleotide synthase [Eubacteriaceae bacterium]MDK2935552.1 pyridinium-3,5-biscarboxylic acid mononucleotide synthase [Eubacteriaceae bacterium]MDK2961344.1 pyridinium-3,5-biscarboxylic acid mononucleotide synthase [Eubacteriaceae bacterium]MDN5307065.1 pyridinium-3,5-biscarboxylic acid mononucleotide synthase [Eubacteriaceae bacterium]